jgi:GTP cyclohydrolase I
MNAPIRADLLADVQSSADPRSIPITRVGIRSVKHPIQIQLSTGQIQHTIAMFNLYVGLPPTQKGTHMSRFIALLEEHNQHVWQLEELQTVLSNMLLLLEASTGRIEVSFPIFLKKKAPISGVESLLDYELNWVVEAHRNQTRTTQVKVVVPVTSLCPCSKQISDYGAHNQRSHITVSMNLSDQISQFSIESVIKQIEKEASCELYGLLKRPDEKYVTERAYDNPKFVEDLVRDIALRLKQNPSIERFILEAENFESIHNHSAYALIDSTDLC